MVSQWERRWWKAGCRNNRKHGVPDNRKGRANREEQQREKGQLQVAAAVTRLGHARHLFRGFKK